MRDRPRLARVLGRTLQMPGIRHMGQVFIAPKVITLVHRGRKSGTPYKTPLPWA